MSKAEIVAEWLELERSTSDNIRKQVELLLRFAKEYASELPLRRVVIRHRGNEVSMGLLETPVQDLYWCSACERLCEKWSRERDGTPIVQPLDRYRLEVAASGLFAKAFFRGQNKTPAAS